MSDIEIHLPRRHLAQSQIIDTCARFNVVALGRRCGKTVMGLDILAEDALDGFPVAYFEPTYNMLADSWRALKDILAPVIASKDEQRHYLELVTGGSVTCWSLENPDSCRGRKYRTVVIDEAAMVKKLSDAWNGAIRPTLTDLHGSAWFLSTPRGVNYFHALYQRGISDDEEWHDWKSWQMPTSANPFIDPGEIASAERETPQSYFRQEYLAEFLELEGAVFRRINEAVDPGCEQPKALDGHEYVMGVDWGKLNDWTVITVIDVRRKSVVHVTRLNQIDYQTQVARLKALHELYRPNVIKAEANSMGEPLIEELRDASLPVQPFTTTNDSKAIIIDGLSLAFDRGDITIPDYPPLIGELAAFEATRLPSGRLRYAAPEGMHDDCVMSLALAWSAVGAGESWLDAYGLIECGGCGRAYDGNDGRCPYCGRPKV